MPEALGQELCSPNCVVAVRVGVVIFVVGARTESDNACLMWSASLKVGAGAP